MLPLAFKSASVIKNFPVVSGQSKFFHSKNFCRWSVDNFAGLARNRIVYFSVVKRLKSRIKELILQTVRRPFKYFGRLSNSVCESGAISGEGEEASSLFVGEKLTLFLVEF